MQKRLVLVCEDSLCPRKQPDISGPGLGEAGCYIMVSEHTTCSTKVEYPQLSVLYRVDVGHSQA